MKTQAFSYTLKLYLHIQISLCQSIPLPSLSLSKKLKEKNMRARCTCHRLHCFFVILLFLLSSVCFSVVSCLQNTLTQSQVPVVLSAMLLKMFPSHTFCWTLFKLNLPVTTFLGCTLRKREKIIYLSTQSIIIRNKKRKENSLSYYLVCTCISVKTMQRSRK